MHRLPWDLCTTFAAIGAVVAYAVLLGYFGFIVLFSKSSSTGLSRNELFTILEGVGDAIGTGICEKTGVGQVLCTDLTMTHVHVQIS